MKKIVKLSVVIFVVAILANCANAQQYNDPVPEHDNFTIESKNLNETRVINVWAPPSYITGNDSIPVMYMPDGGIKEDFPHIANTIAKLIEEKSIPPMLLVGIENTDRRRDLTGFSEVKEDEEYCPLTDGAKNFRAFITEELFNHINSNYRTTNKKGIIGESLAGLFIMETFFLSPKTFDFYIAMDPSLWWNDHYLERNAKAYIEDFPNQDTKLWFAGSGVEDISSHTKSLAETFKTHAPKQLTWTYSDEPNEKHSTIYRATKEKALRWTFKK